MTYGADFFEELANGTQTFSGHAPRIRGSESGLGGGISKLSRGSLFDLAGASRPARSVALAG
jgi:hypothetical protein